MAESPNRDEALKKLQADLLEFIAQGRQERVSREEVSEIAAELAMSVNARLEDTLMMTAKKQAGIVSDAIVHRLKADAPELFERAKAVPAAEALPADDYASMPSRATELKSAEALKPGIALQLLRYWPATLLLLVLILLSGGLAYANYVQMQQLALERRVQAAYSNDLDQACGVFLEIEGESKILEDSYKTYCSPNTPKHGQDLACRFSDKLKRWRSARPVRCEPNPQ